MDSGRTLHSLHRQRDRHRPSCAHDGNGQAKGGVRLPEGQFVSQVCWRSLICDRFVSGTASRPFESIPRLLGSHLDLIVCKIDLTEHEIDSFCNKKGLFVPMLHWFEDKIDPFENKTDLIAFRKVRPGIGCCG
jgi:hypothetical protein